MTTITHLEAKQLGCIRQGRWLFPPVSFAFKAGELLLVEGENGAGKSSLLRLIANIATPAAGNVYWNHHSTQENSSEYAEQLHYIGHANGIRPGLTIAENLALAAELSQQPAADPSSVLSLLQLYSHQDKQTQFLSAGQKRRTALARLLLIPRKLWILDEPLTSLDAATQKIFLAKVTEHLKNGGLCVITSHQPVTLAVPVQTLRLTSC